MATIRSQATELDVFAGVDRDITIELTFVDENDAAHNVSANDVTAAIAQPVPVAFTVQQGSGANVVELSLTSAEVGNEERADTWYVEVSGNEWLRGTWTVTADPVKAAESDDVTVVVTEISVQVTVYT